MLLSTSLKNLIAGQEGYAHALTNVNAGATIHTGLGKLYIYSGTDPLSADAALSGPVLLGTVTSDAGVGSQFLTFAAATGGVLAKNATEVWSTGAMTIAGGPKTATFARFCQGAGSPTSADAGGTSTATPRVHLTIRQAGQASGDINLTSSVYNTGDNFILDLFQLNF